MNNEAKGSSIYRIAIIGSGPAGFFAAGYLFDNKDLNIEIDMYDKLPTPFGLVRSGVAPDHQKVKSVTRVYNKIAENPKFRFYGLVEFGLHITLEDLKKFYHQVIFATGTQTDRRMKISGEGLERSYTATEFVAWYNGHPAFVDFDFDLTVEKVAIVGIGNVAVDVARILCRSANELSKTDITDYAFDKLINSNVKEIYMLGRRGPAQAAFTNPEIRELQNLESADVITLKKEVELDALTTCYLSKNPVRSTEKKVQMLKEFSENTCDKDKRLIIRFLVSPVELLPDGEGGVKGIKLAKNELFRSDDGSLRARPTGEHEILEVGTVFRSIGYYGTPLAGVPFDEYRGIIPNKQGRVTDEKGNSILGLYTAGWIKRGPTGVIGTNKMDSSETVSAMVDDIRSNKTFKPEFTSSEKVETLLEESKGSDPGYIDYADWLEIDKDEVSKGKIKGKPRVKFTTVEDIRKLLNKKRELYS